jgi:sulfate permease, SulP family
MKLSPSLLLEPFRPVAEDVRAYSGAKFRRDVIAGLTVSVVNLPQAMAYAIIAGVSPEYGIYTSVIQGVIGALLSSSPHLMTGPTNTQALLIASVVTRLSGAAAPEAAYLQLVFLLAFVKGVLQVIFAAARFGDLVQFIGRSVILGVAAGSGVLIALNQLPAFLGLPKLPPSPWPGVIGMADRMWPYLTQVNWPTVGIGVLTLAIVVGSRMISKFVPGALLGVVIASGVVMMLGLDGTVKTIGPLAGHFPMPAWPAMDVSLMLDLIPGALALATLGAIEAVAIAKSIGSPDRAQVRANQEFFAQGTANVVGSFFHCFPTSASFSRSALNHAAGGATRFAGLIDAGCVAVMFLLLAPQAQHIPYASLAAVLFVVSWGLIDRVAITRLIRADRSDAVVCLVTLAATMFAPLEYAIFVGIFLNIAFYLRTSSRLHIAEMVQTDTGGFMERPIYDKQSGERRVIFIQLEGELFFAIADQLRDQLSTIRRSGVRVVVIRLKRCHSIDGTVLDVLEQFVKQTRQRNGHVLLCGLRPEVSRTLHHYGLLDLVGRENVFAAEQGVFNSARRALQRARVLVGSSIDVSGIKLDDDGELTYDI